MDQNKMSDINEMFVVEYSVQGRCVHIHTVHEMLKTNLQHILDGVSNDYKPVALAKSAEEASQQADIIEDAIKKRKTPKTGY